MCLIVFSFRSHDRYPLIFAGNRDEFHGRPTAPAHFWEDHPGILAGRDLKAGGTWLGVSRAGRFATVTNFREPDENRPDARSRGELVTNFLLDARSPDVFLDEIVTSGAEYNGFNLIFGDAGHLYYASNSRGSAKQLEPGLYGLSNGRLDTPWPKVRRAKELFREVTEREAVDSEALLDVLADEWRPPDDALPRTGIGVRWERMVSSIFIAGEEYGTRASTVVLIDSDGELTFVERSYGPGGAEAETEAFRLSLDVTAADG